MTKWCTLLLQEEEYRERQYGEVDRKPGDPTQAELEGLQAQGELIGSSSMDMPDLTGRQGTLGSGYFDAAGNWQTYEYDAAAEEPTVSRYTTLMLLHASCCCCCCCCCIELGLQGWW